MFCFGCVALSCLFDTFSGGGGGGGGGGGWAVGKSDSKENPKSDLDLDLGFVKNLYYCCYEKNAHL